MSSSGEDIKVSYYSSILAKALKEEDGDKFTTLYDLIVRKVSKEQASLAVERARELSERLPLPTLSSKITWLESHCGIEPLDVRSPETTCTTETMSNKRLPTSKFVTDHSDHDEFSEGIPAISGCRSDFLREPVLFKTFQRDGADLTKMYQRAEAQGECSASKAALPENRVNQYIDEECEDDDSDTIGADEIEDRYNDNSDTYMQVDLVTDENSSAQLLPHQIEVVTGNRSDFTVSNNSEEQPLLGRNLNGNLVCIPQPNMGYRYKSFQPRSDDCVIDMPDMSDLSETDPASKTVDFGLSSGSAFNNRVFDFNGGGGRERCRSYEMKEIRRHSAGDALSADDTDENQNNEETKKMRKKKKKSKRAAEAPPVSASSDFKDAKTAEKAAKPSGRNVRRQKLKEAKSVSGSSASQAVVPIEPVKASAGAATSVAGPSHVARTQTEQRKKKRTVKDYKEEQLKLRSTQHFYPGYAQGYTQDDTALRYMRPTMVRPKLREQSAEEKERKAKECLTEEKVLEIVQSIEEAVGDGGKKKQKEQKQQQQQQQPAVGVGKKKKGKKQKKAEAGGAKKAGDEGGKKTMVDPGDEDRSPKAVEAASGENFPFTAPSSPDSRDDFVFERSRKRRFSDPSPSTSGEIVNQASDAIATTTTAMGASDAAAAFHHHHQRHFSSSSRGQQHNTVAASSSESAGVTGSSSSAFCTVRANDDSHWPKLSAAAFPPSGESVSVASGASGQPSYASKLKTNLDSTGCSLASSSEDSSSSSSSTAGAGHQFSASPPNEADSQRLVSEFISMASKHIGVEVTPAPVVKCGSSGGAGEPSLPTSVFDLAKQKLDKATKERSETDKRKPVARAASRPDEAVASPTPPSSKKDEPLPSASDSAAGNKAQVVRKPEAVASKSECATRKDIVVAAVFPPVASDAAERKPKSQKQRNDDKPTGEVDGAKHADVAMKRAINGSPGVAPKSHELKDRPATDKDVSSASDKANDRKTGGKKSAVAKRAAVSNVAEKADGNSDAAAAVDVTFPPEVETMLENKWGLEFILRDRSLTSALTDHINNKTSPESLFRALSDSVLSSQPPARVSGADDAVVKRPYDVSSHLSFGDDAEESVAMEVKPNAAKLANVAAKKSPARRNEDLKNTAAASVYNMRLAGGGGGRPGRPSSTTPWNDPGFFDLNEATRLLLREWSQAASNGHRFNESKVYL